MIVVCNQVVVTGDQVYHQPDEEIDVPAEEAARLLQLGAARLPGQPNPDAWRDKGAGTYSISPLGHSGEPGIYRLPKPLEY